MDIFLVAGLFFGTGAILLGVFAFGSWRAICRYEHDIMFYLEDDPDCYVEQVMYDFYDAGRRAFDAATEMKAMHYED